MPFTFNGIGTALYGARDFGPDGSYTTTEWIVLAYLPVVPLKSMRILETGEGRNYGVYASSRYYVLDKLGLNLRQVLSVYGLLAFICLCVSLAVGFESFWLAIPAIAALGAPWYLRRRAIQRMAAQYGRGSAGATA